SPTKSINLSETAEVPACNVPSRSPLFSLSYADHRNLHNNRHSFPTRRSSDLQASALTGLVEAVAALDADRAGRIADQARSEEHTSELQSPVVISYAVFCLK